MTTPMVWRRGELMPRTIDYKCHRCLLVLPSKPLPPARDRRTGLPNLMIYDLPEGWDLIVRPLGELDWCRCVECQKDVARGAPEELGGPR